MSAPALSLRAAAALDAGGAAALLSDFVDRTLWMPRLHSRAEDVAHLGQMILRDWVRVACEGPEIVGFLARDGGDVHALYVAHERKRAGVGTALLKEAQATCAELTLWTFEANMAAQAFYLKHGFEEVARTAGENDEGLPDIRYRWSAEGTT